MDDVVAGLTDSVEESAIVLYTIVEGVIQAAQVYPKHFPVFFVSFFEDFFCFSIAFWLLYCRI